MSPLVMVEEVSQSFRASNHSFIQLLGVSSGWISPPSQPPLKSLEQRSASLLVVKLCGPRPVIIAR